MASKSVSSGKAGNSNILGAVSYLFAPITSVLIYLIAGNDKFAKFHAVQSLFWVIALVVLNFLLLISIVGAPLALLVGIAGFISWLFLMYKAITGERYRLPYIGEWAEKYSS